MPIITHLSHIHYACLRSGVILDGGTQGKRQMRRKMPMKNKDRGEEMCLTRLQGAYTPEASWAASGQSWGGGAGLPASTRRGPHPGGSLHVSATSSTGPFLGLVCSTPESVKSSLHLPSFKCVVCQSFSDDQVSFSREDSTSTQQTRT